MREGSLRPPEFNASPAHVAVVLRRHGAEVPELRDWLRIGISLLKRIPYW